jgi:hypothetical protein
MIVSGRSRAAGCRPYGAANDALAGAGFASPEWRREWRVGGSGILPPVVWETFHKESFHYETTRFIMK